MYYVSYKRIVYCDSEAARSTYSVVAFTLIAHFRSVAILSDFSNSSRAFPYHGALAGDPFAIDGEIFAKELKFASLAENSNMWGVGGRDVSQP
jgi:argininosuccinate lyase